MKKNGRRLVVAPASMSHSQDSKHSRLSADAVVAFELEVVRVCRKHFILHMTLSNHVSYSPSSLEPQATKHLAHVDFML